MQCKLTIAIICVFISVCASAQVGASARTIILPSPQLIHCHSADCSQLWKQSSARDGQAVFPSQIMTDFVKGEVVGLTAVYDKSVSEIELRASIEGLYGKATFNGVSVLSWRVVREEFAIMISHGMEGAIQVTYLKFGTPASLVPSAHVDCRK